MRLSTLLFLASALPALACDGCNGAKDMVMTRNVRRMQPEAIEATTRPQRPLEWGQLNAMHTTDTHGWLAGHLREQNYGADWGDFVSFTKHMKQKAKELCVDLLLIDTGDLHDGTGLSDTTDPNGKISNRIFENIDYDLLAIGNHELYVTEIAYETFNQFAKVYGDRYVTSNVQIKNPKTKEFEYIGSKYRYFTTEHGLRIMAFGVLFDFTSNSDVSRVIKSDVLIKQEWFKNAVHYDKSIDLFILIGHNPVRPGEESSFVKIQKAIRKMRPDVPIQGFGGHSHVRDFIVYDETSTGLESGRYCETLGWLAMSGIDSPTYTGSMKPKGVPHPTRKAISTDNKPREAKESTSLATKSSSTPMYARRYLDWNRLTFAYHSKGSQDGTFNTTKGEKVTNEITEARKKLDLTKLFGCAPKTWCQFCKPFGAPGNIFGLIERALATTVVDESRAENPRMIIINTGSIRFDLVKGPFTLDDSFVVSPFADGFQYIPKVPYEMASKVLGILNRGPPQKKKRDLSTQDLGLDPMGLVESDACVDPPLPLGRFDSRGDNLGSIVRRQSTKPVPGYTTKDDFGDDGDDTVHSKIPNYPQPNDIQATAAFPSDGSDPKTVDFIFYDFIASYILDALNSVGGDYKEDDVTYYLPKSFTSNDFLPKYAKLKWQKNVPNCPTDTGIGK